MVLQERIRAFAGLGHFINNFLKASEESERLQLQSDSFKSFDYLISQTCIINPWFRRADVFLALKAISNEMDITKIENWMGNYPGFCEPAPPRKIGVVMAGNIPLAGFFDFFYVLISGNYIFAKLSSQDELLLPFFAEILLELEPEFSNSMQFVKRLQGFEAVIASGSGNSSRYFDYYFGKVPNLIRKNRNSCALISSKESDEDIVKLGIDVFSYFGAGCRNVSKLYVPENYDFGQFFRPLEAFFDVSLNNKYANNYEYNKAIFLVKLLPFLDNGFLMLRNEMSMAAPRAVLHFEYYENVKDLSKHISSKENEIQCVLSAAGFFPEFSQKLLTFGSSQYPSLSDYADKVDVMRFLMNLN